MILRVKGTDLHLPVAPKNEEFVENYLKVQGTVWDAGFLEEGDGGNIYCSEDTLEWWGKLFAIESYDQQLAFYRGEA